MAVSGGSRKALDADIVVGANIRKFRAEHGLTLQELASRLRVSHQQLQKYETGTNRVSAGVLYLVAEAFQVPVEALFDGIDDNTGEDAAAKALQLARNKCRIIVDRATSLAVLDSMANVLRVLHETD